MTRSQTMLSGEAVPAQAQAPDATPFVHEFFMVQVDGFRGMAYRDEDGKWRSAYKDEELPGDINLFD